MSVSLNASPLASTLLNATQSRSSGLQASGQVASPQGTAPDTSGLVFNPSGARYNGQVIALSDVIDDKSGKFTDAQKGQADDVLQAREQKAFGYLYPSGSFAGTDAQKNAQLAQYYTAYANYLQNLPPAEQNSQRYAGQLPQAEALKQYFSGAGGWASGTNAPKVQSQSSLVYLLQQIVVAQRAAGSSQVSAAGDTVTLSDQAKQFLANQQAGSNVPPVAG